MDEQQLQLRQQPRLRNFLRIAGASILFVGVVLMITGVASFFSSFGGMEPPRYFWCTFVAIPLLPIGGSMLSLGFYGAIQRYIAGESAPVAKDAFNYLGENTRPGVTAITSAIREGLATPPVPPQPGDQSRPPA